MNKILFLITLLFQASTSLAQGVFLDTIYASTNVIESAQIIVETGKGRVNIFPAKVALIADDYNSGENIFSYHLSSIADVPALEFNSGSIYYTFKVYYSDSDYKLLNIRAKTKEELSQFSDIDKLKEELELLKNKLKGVDSSRESIKNSSPNFSDAIISRVRQLKSERLTKKEANKLRKEIEFLQGVKNKLVLDSRQELEDESRKYGEEMAKIRHRQELIAKFGKLDPEELKLRLYKLRRRRAFYENEIKKISR